MGAFACSTDEKKNSKNQNYRSNLDIRQETSIPTFEEVMTNDELLDHFKSWAEKMMAEKNLVFFLKVKEYRNLAEESPEEAKKLAKEIVDLFLTVGSKYEVTITQNTRRKVLDRLRSLSNTKNVDPEVFNPALSVTMRSLKFDQFHRFQDVLKNVVKSDSKLREE